MSCASVNGGLVELSEWLYTALVLVRTGHCFGPSDAPMPLPDPNAVIEDQLAKQSTVADDDGDFGDDLDDGEDAAIKDRSVHEVTLATDLAQKLCSAVGSQLQSLILAHQLQNRLRCSGDASELDVLYGMTAQSWVLGSGTGVSDWARACVCLYDQMVQLEVLQPCVNPLLTALSWLRHVDDLMFKSVVSVSVSQSRDWLQLVPVAKLHWVSASAAEASIAPSDVPPVYDHKLVQQLVAIEHWATADHSQSQTGPLTVSFLNQLMQSELPSTLHLKAVRTLIMCLGAVSEVTDTHDKALRRVFLQCFHTLFKTATLAEKVDCLQLCFATHSLSVLTFHLNDQRFVKDGVSAWTNRLMGNASAEQTQHMATELCEWLLLSPRYVCRKVLCACVQEPSIAHTAVRVLRLLPPIILVHDSDTPLLIAHSPEHRMLNVVVEQILRSDLHLDASDEKHGQVDASAADRWEQLLVCLCRKTRATGPGSVTQACNAQQNTAVLHVTDLMNSLLLPALPMPLPDSALAHCLLRLCTRLLINNSSDILWHVNNQPQSTVTNHSGVNVVQLVCVLCSKWMHYKQQNECLVQQERLNELSNHLSLQDSCLRAIKCVLHKSSACERLSVPSVEYILGGIANTYWPLVFWLSSQLALNSLLRKVSSCVYGVLTETSRSKYEYVACTAQTHEHACDECVLNALFLLCTLDEQLALNLLQDVNVSALCGAQLWPALVQVLSAILCSHDVGAWKRVLSLLRALHKRRHIVHAPFVHSQADMHAVKAAQLWRPMLLMGDVLLCYLRSANTDDNHTAWQDRGLVKHLVSNYCQLCKSVADECLVGLETSEEQVFVAAAVLPPLIEQTNTLLRTMQSTSDTTVLHLLHRALVDAHGQVHVRVHSFEAGQSVSSTDRHLAILALPPASAISPSCSLQQSVPLTADNQPQTFKDKQSVYGFLVGTNNTSTDHSHMNMANAQVPVPQPALALGQHTQMKGFGMFGSGSSNTNRAGGNAEWNGAGRSSNKHSNAERIQSTAPASARKQRHTAQTASHSQRHTGSSNSQSPVSDDRRTSHRHGTQSVSWIRESRLNNLTDKERDRWEKDRAEWNWNEEQSVGVSKNNSNKWPELSGAVAAVPDVPCVSVPQSGAGAGAMSFATVAASHALSTSTSPSPH